MISSKHTTQSPQCWCLSGLLLEDENMGMLFKLENQIPQKNLIWEMINQINNVLGKEKE